MLAHLHLGITTWEPPEPLHIRLSATQSISFRLFLSRYQDNTNNYSIITSNRNESKIQTAAVVAEFSEGSFIFESRNSLETHVQGRKREEKAGCEKVHPRLSAKWFQFDPAIAWNSEKRQAAQIQCLVGECVCQYWPTELETKSSEQSLH